MADRIDIKHTSSTSKLSTPVLHQGSRLNLAEGRKYLDLDATSLPAAAIVRSGWAAVNGRALWAELRTELQTRPIPVDA